MTSSKGFKPKHPNKAVKSARQTAAELGVKVSRSKGQNFLQDPNVASKIVDLSGVAQNDTVLEIGPGLGALTTLLAGRVGRLILIEIEPILAARLRSQFATMAHVEVIEADFRKLELREFARKLKIVSNLPYSISTEICLKLFDNWQVVDSATLMLQREFAERLAAAPGGRDFGSITLKREMVADIEPGFVVPASAFSPQPKVESMVITMRFLPQPRLPESAAKNFEAVVRKAFQKRRKTLANALEGAFELSKSDLRAIFESLNIDPGRRPETLSFLEFSQLAKKIGGG